MRQSLAISHCCRSYQPSAISHQLRQRNVQLRPTFAFRRFGLMADG
jgi:hypothetical protein